MFRLFDSAAVSGRTLPACIRRNLLVDAGVSRCARICCLRESVVVVLGLSIVRMRSGLEVEKRMTISRGASLVAAIAFLRVALLRMQTRAIQCDYCEDV